MKEISLPKNQVISYLIFGARLAEGGTAIEKKFRLCIKMCTEQEGTKCDKGDQVQR